MIDKSHKTELRIKSLRNKLSFRLIVEYCRLGLYVLQILEEFTQ